MSHQSLYRKYRSQSFADLVGQDHVVRTLQNALKTGRFAHAYLFTGPRGTGKTSTARLVAKALCCESGPSTEPCNTCSNCIEISRGSFVDVVEMDAASESKVEEVRERIVEVADYRPMVARFKVFIIDEVHDLSAKAFDALLKTIEEPPAHLVFILATTEYNSVPPTIRSRCQKFEFHRASMPDLVGRMEFVCREEGVEADPAALSAIARMADGGFRDALTLLEQAILTAEGHITIDHIYAQLGLVSEDAIDAILTSVKGADIPGILTSLEEIARRGRDPGAIVESALYRLADLTRASYGLEVGGMESTRQAAMHEVAVRIGRDALLRIRGELASAHKALREVSLPRLWLEAEFVRIAQALEVAASAPSMPTIATAPSTAERQRDPGRLAESLAAKAAAVRTPANESPKRADDSEGKPEKKQAKSSQAIDLDEANRLWKLVVEEVPGDAPIGKRLAGSHVHALAEGTMTIQVASPPFAEWMIADLRRKNYLSERLKKIAGQNLELQFVSVATEMALDAPASVEVPLEGESLKASIIRNFELGSSEENSAETDYNGHNRKT